MVLVDTSVWIELFAGRANASREDFLTMATCGPVIQEVVQGLRTGRQAQQLRWQFLGLLRLGDPVGADLFIDAADSVCLSQAAGIEDPVLGGLPDRVDRDQAQDTCTALQPRL